ncbi:YheC/YheD family protein [Paenibacillus sp. J2TS4]|uniref:YheC/YheD family protein n=1 Tax=Paenibacillus sp. J2TS4 TaxID=2807194 RepID=UPI001B095C83|nr:YheC/YheD family protein [Paenibacillus sp. J2TS4]GIP31218.1 hypothetical protein J2TS4_04280 [Paenibacillus sp. J2TS4]
MSTKNYNSTTLVGKLKVYHYLAANHRVNKHLPYTVSFSKKNLKQMTELFRAVYIKPNVGSQGIGIYKVEKGEGGFTLRSTKKLRQFTDIQALYRYLLRNKKKKLLIQQAVRLERVQGNPYDLRAMVQRKPKGKWTCTGIVAKIGKPNKIVTNYHQGGKIVRMSRLFNQLQLTPEEGEERLRKIRGSALQIARVLSARKSGMREMGIDFAVDEESKQLMVLEVNSRQPQLYPIKPVDRAMYNRMMSYARSYGRKRG